MAAAGAAALTPRYLDGGAADGSLRARAWLTLGECLLTTHNHGFFLSAVLLKCMGRLAYSSNNVEVLLPLSLLGHSKNMYIEKSGLGR